MLEDDALRSKYARLGIEFKKLRERYRSLKDTYTESIDRIGQLETKLSDQSIHKRNLEQEKESLIFRNQFLTKQAAFLEKQLEAVNQKRRKSLRDGSPVEFNPQDEAFKNALLEVNRLHEELISQSSTFLARIAELEAANAQRSQLRCVSASVQTSTLPDLSPFNQSTSSVDATSSSLDALCLQDLDNEAPPSVKNTPSSVVSSTSARNETLRSPQGNNARGSAKIPPQPATNHLLLSSSSFSSSANRKHSLPNSLPDLDCSKDQLTRRENLLIERISQLEGELAEMALKQRLETRRSQLSQQAAASTPTEGELCEHRADDCDVPGLREKLLVEHYEELLRDRNRKIAVYEGRITDAFDEIRSLHAHLTHLRSQLEAAKTSGDAQQQPQKTGDRQIRLASASTASTHSNNGDLRPRDGGLLSSPPPNANSGNAFIKNSFLASLLR